jgi:hypothetical protein
MYVIFCIHFKELREMNDLKLVFRDNLCVGNCIVLQVQHWTIEFDPQSHLYAVFDC